MAILASVALPDLFTLLAATTPLNNLISKQAILCKESRSLAYGRPKKWNNNARFSKLPL